MSKSFGETLKQLREQAGLSQAALAELTGMNQYGVAKLEQGVRMPAWETMMALCKALGVRCTAFEDAYGADPPAEGDGPGPGRPRRAKEPAEEPSPAKAEGKPRKRTRKKDK